MERERIEDAAQAVLRGAADVLSRASGGGDRLGRRPQAELGPEGAAMEAQTRSVRLFAPALALAGFAAASLIAARSPV